MENRELEEMLRQIPECFDDELLKEYETARNLDIPLPNPEPSPEQFERIWERIQAEQEKAEKVVETERKSMICRFFHRLKRNI